MSAVNDTQSQFAVFLLTGIPGHEQAHVWIAISFSIMYAISIVGNAAIIFFIKTDPSLHEPMYIFLSMLAVTDLGLSISTIPTILGFYVFNSREIIMDACFSQLYFVHLFSITESSMLLLMAFDRFIAIFNPLRYTSILSPRRIAKMGLVFVVRGVVVTVPFPVLLRRYQYCQTNILSHCYCLNQDVMKLSCSDIRVSSFYGLFVVISTVALDALLIVVSYVMILKTVLGIASRIESLRALNTCVSHICAVVLYYTPMLGLPVLHRFGDSSTHLLQTLLGYIYLMAPPLMNPIVYSIKSKHLRARIIRVFVK
ncbi:olfactory receptor 51G2-like [Pelodiscus sinensis]|uniref:olfactory receptor 51G2-like n=1 Tax=Pelodiscus sinensis TaxID=13735 RepID=UPI003F6D988B